MSGIAVYTASGRRAGWVQLEGTSAAAAQVAAVIALLDQHVGHAIGTRALLNLLYSLARSEYQQTAFRHIGAGPGGNGYDLGTSLGSLVVPELIRHL